MAPTLYSRIYSRLSDLIPSFASIAQAGAMYAAPRQKDDMALFCVVTPTAPGTARVEIAHDQVTSSQACSEPWMIFEVDHLSATAELIGFTDERVYYKKVALDDQLNPQRTSLNVYAVNWLACFINLHFQFALAPNTSPIPSAEITAMAI